MGSWDKDRIDKTTGMTRMNNRLEDRAMVNCNSEENRMTDTSGEDSEEAGAEVDQTGDQRLWVTVSCRT